MRKVHITKGSFPLYIFRCQQRCVSRNLCSFVCTPVSLLQTRHDYFYQSSPALQTAAPCPDPVSMITADTVVPPSQDEPTEGTMSSKALPLIFEPLEDVTSEEAAAESAVTPEPGGARCSAAPEVDLEQLDAVEADSDGPSRAPPPLVPDWTTPWQASGTEVLETVSSLGPSVLPPQAGAEPEHLPDRGQRADVAIHEPKCQHNSEHH